MDGLSQKFINKLITFGETSKCFVAKLFKRISGTKTWKKRQDLLVFRWSRTIVDFALGLVASIATLIELLVDFLATHFNITCSTCCKDFSISINAKRKTPPPPPLNFIKNMFFIDRLNFFFAVWSIYVFIFMETEMKIAPSRKSLNTKRNYY